MKLHKIVGTNFYVEEIFPLEWIDRWGHEYVTRFIPYHSLMMLQRVRDFFGKSLIVNNKCFGGDYNYSGYRYIGCGEGKENGEHYRGLAFDIKIDDMDSLMVRHILVRNYRILGITMIEDEINGWNHIACPWFIGHELELAIWKNESKILEFKDEFDVLNYKVSAT